MRYEEEEEEKMMLSVEMKEGICGIVRHVSFYKGKEDKGRIKGTIISALKITLPLSLYRHLF